jgi:hypothetical protein
MRPHPYLRAYMAGIVVPTMFLLVAFTIYAYFRFLAAPSDFIAPLVSRPFERAIVFPLAVVPNLWGAWNMLHMALRRRMRMPLALHGALLPILLVPSGVLLGRALAVFTIPWSLAVTVIPIGMTLYYLAWKYLVGFLNEEMGIA